MKKIIFIIILLVGIYWGYSYFKSKEDVPPKFIYEDILTSIDQKVVDVNSFTIYGKYLNLKGNLPEEKGNYTLVLKNNEEEIVVNTDIEENTFSTSKYINQGLNLEKLKIGNYIILLHNTVSDSYYNLSNKTEYHSNKYYTMTKNMKNNLITFNEETFNEINYWTINIQEEKLPEDVYDIVLDPGHGGIDTGAGNGRYHESDFNLDNAKTLKAVLEEEGFKVKLTREDDTNIEKYGAGSRTGIPYEVKAKLMLSIHLNSSNSKKENGVEVYYAYGDNNTFAKVIADNIVTYANTKYSINTQNRVDNGVYMRVYSKSDIAQLTREAKRDGYTPYDFTDHETYYFFIRETGGIMTGAFSDGRNPKYKENIYRNYNQGVEAYLLELAYISNNDDLKNVINNKDGYIKAIKESVISYSEIAKNKESNEIS